MNSINFKDNEEKKEALIEFLNNQYEFRREYYTNGDGLDCYAELYESHLIQEKINRDDDELSKVLKEYLPIIGESKLSDAICNNYEMEAHGIYSVDNCIFQYPIGEIEDQLTGISGTINEKEVNCIFSVLSEGLTDDEINRLSIDGYISNGYQYINLSYDTACMRVNIDGLLESIKDQIEFDAR